MLNRLTDSLDFHGQALALRSERQRLIASNIANADTPGYVARDMNFAQALREATGNATGGLPATLSTSTAGHIAAATGARDRAQSAVRQRRARPTSTATPSTWTASAPPSPTTR